MTRTFTIPHRALNGVTFARKEFNRAGIRRDRRYRFELDWRATVAYHERFDATCSGFALVQLADAMGGLTSAAMGRTFCLTHTFSK